MNIQSHLLYLLIAAVYALLAVSAYFNSKDSATCVALFLVCAAYTQLALVEGAGK